MRVPGFSFRRVSAASSKPGANSTSMNCSASRSPNASLTGRFRTTTPPYAESGSAFSARSYACSIEPETATPHGVACLTITHVRRPVLVLPGAADGGDVREFFRRPRGPRRPADVDHLDGVLLADRAPRNDVLERIEVHADEVERLDVVLVQCGVVVGPVAARENRGVDPRVQRLDPAAEELGHLGQLLDRRHVDPELVQERGRAAARHELEVELREAPCELLEPALVVD